MHTKTMLMPSSNTPSCRNLLVRSFERALASLVRWCCSRSCSNVSERACVHVCLVDEDDRFRSKHL
jgi:hypothetical protein